MSKVLSLLNINKDIIGFAASMLCAIHCVALPLILTVSTLSGLAFLGNHLIEFVFLIISAIIATWSLIPAFKKHQKKLPIAIAIIGFIFLITSRFLPCGPTEHYVTAVGGFTVAISHLLNWKYLKKTSCSTHA